MFFDKLDNNLKNKISVLETGNTDYVECVIYVKDFEYSRKIFADYKHDVIELIHEYPFLNAFGVRIKTDDLSNLAQLSQVIFISSQAKIYAQTTRAKQVMNLNSLYKKGLTGKNTCVAILDTGIAPHLDFCIPKKRIIHFEDFVNKKKLPYDDNGHGTMVAGILSGNGIKSVKQKTGIAPESELVILKCLNADGQTTTIEMLNAMQWVYDNHIKYNIKIVCMSFGATPASNNDPLIKGVEVLWNAGITVVVAGGNSGPDYHSIKSPGASNKIITVGALDDGRNQENSNSHNEIEKDANIINAKFLNKNNQNNVKKSLKNNKNIVFFTNNEDFSNISQNLSIPDFSSRGPSFGLYKPDLLAPGVDILATSNDLSYDKMSGTSASTPLVAGVCALLLEYNNTLTPSQIKEILISNCHTLGYDRNTEGFGFLSFD